MSDRAFQSGEPAEKMFVAYAKVKNMPISRYGLDDISVALGNRLPQFVRSSPDYLALYNGSGVFVECKAGGNKHYVNFKVRDFPMLKQWNAIMPVYLFFNDGYVNNVCLISFDDLSKILVFDKGVKTSLFGPDKRPFYNMPKEAFTWEKFYAPPEEDIASSET